MELTLLTRACVCAAPLALASTQGHAMSITADYTEAGGSEIVSGFNIYDMSVGAAVQEDGLIIPGLGETREVKYIATVESHRFNGVPVADPGLGVTYEITAVADFTLQAGPVAPGSSLRPFSVIGGTLSFYHDAANNYSITSDSGFDDGVQLFQGTFTGGSGAFDTTSGFGFSSIVANIVVDSVNAAVYDPDVIGLDGIFTLQANSGDVGDVVAAGSFGGDPVEVNDLVLGADGNLQLTAVPVPAAVWLFGTAAAGLGIVRRRSA